MARAHINLAFGPIPSRRLGRSLGINNIPPKSCGYSCVYCQVGPTQETTIARQDFYPPESIFEAVKTRLDQLDAAGEGVDYLTFVPDGEPTLDRYLGQSITLLRELGRPIAVITNASLLWREDVRRDLLGADWVSLKVDAVSEQIWRQINKPHPSLNLEQIHEGMKLFADEFAGILATETMLMSGFNDSEEELIRIARFLGWLRPLKAFIAIPTRPTAETGIEPADEKALSLAYKLTAEHVPQIQLLVGGEEGSYGCTGDLRHDLLGITAVHPMTVQAVRELVAKTGERWQAVDQMVAEGLLKAIPYRGQTYYLRQLPGPDNQTTEPVEPPK